MAGIGFELRKIYNEDSLFSKQKAYAYAGIVYTGPMLLGILLTAGVVVLTMVGGISENERDYILSNLRYHLFSRDYQSFLVGGNPLCCGYALREEI